MERTPLYTYDEEGDILYISFYPGKKGTGVELNDHILLRFNREEKKALGLTFLDFSVLVQMTDMGPRSWPLTGLANIATAIRDVVVEIITTAPVSHFLKVSSYSPSLYEVIPITRVEKPSGEAILM